MGDYTLRDIPTDLHRAWKTAAAIKGIPMKQYAFIALKKMVSETLKIGILKAKKDGGTDV